MTTKAHVEHDWAYNGIKAVIYQLGAQVSTTRLWPKFPARLVVPNGEQPQDTDADTDQWLRLNEDEARALYEALAAYFGGAGHDTRALRRDYDAERKRVDLFIAHLTRAAIVDA